MAVEPEVVGIAYDPSFSSLEFDRDHGAEVEAAMRELAAQAHALRHAA